MDQPSLFEPDAPAYPPGFRYQPGLITPTTESALLAEVRKLPFREFEFHGFTGKRRVVSFGWHYDFAAHTLHRVDDIPAFLQPLRDVAAGFAGVDASRLQQALVTEYAVGAPIGWHRDKAEFGIVVGISLLSDCIFRLRRRVGEHRERVNLIAAARSAYLLSGAARSEWEHSVPPVEALRYSVTFRNLREG